MLTCRYLLPHHPEVSIKGHRNCKQRQEWDKLYTINDKGNKVYSQTQRAN